MCRISASKVIRHVESGRSMNHSAWPSQTVVPAAKKRAARACLSFAKVWTSLHPVWRRSLAYLLAVVMLATPHGQSQGALAQADPCPEPNDEIVSACPLAAGVTLQSYIDHLGDVDIYRIDLSTLVELRLDLTDLPADYDLYLADGFGGVYGQSRLEGTAAEHISTQLVAGVYFVVVQADPAREIDVTRPYSLRVEVAERESVAEVDSTGRHILFGDNFDDPTRSRLPIASRRPLLFSIGYIDGEYRIATTDPSGRYWGTILPGTYDDAVLSVRTRLVGDTDRREIALGCRRQSINGSDRIVSMYRLHINPFSRTFTILRWDEYQRVALVPTHSSDAIRPDIGWNLVELSCVGSSISAMANGELLASVRDTLYTRGAFVLGTGSLDPAHRRTEARFDDLVVTDR